MAIEPPAPKIYYPPPKTDGAIIPGRPGCLTTYLFLVLFDEIFSGYWLFFDNATISLYDPPRLLLSRAIFIGFAIAELIAFIGAWRMKNWGRWLWIVIVVAAIALTIILFVFENLLAPQATPVLSS